MRNIIKDDDVLKKSPFDSSVNAYLNYELKRVLQKEAPFCSSNILDITALKSAQQFKECPLGKTLIKECLANQIATAHPASWLQYPANKVKCNIDYLHSSFVALVTLTTATTQQAFERLCFTAGYISKAILAAVVTGKSTCLLLGISRIAKGHFVLLIDSKDNRWNSIMDELIATLNTISKDETQ